MRTMASRWSTIAWRYLEGLNTKGPEVAGHFESTQLSAQVSPKSLLNSAYRATDTGTATEKE
jgi:hypothetical protein